MGFTAVRAKAPGRAPLAGLRPFCEGRSRRKVVVLLGQMKGTTSASADIYVPVQRRATLDPKARRRDRREGRDRRMADGELSLPILKRSGRMLAKVTAL
jgi:hypothetical protein